MRVAPITLPFVVPRFAAARAARPHPPQRGRRHQQQQRTALDDGGATSREAFWIGPEVAGPQAGLTGRHRRPPPTRPSPPDPVNALLSFDHKHSSTTPLRRWKPPVSTPCPGFLHQPRAGHHNPALDLIEEFRPVIIDSVVLQVLHTGMRCREDFVTDPARRSPAAVLETG
jgi:CRISPR/Cas system-associated endonuclease Cas1